jgi:hypothetical protein
LLLAFFTSSVALWVLNIVLDICFGSYIYILLKIEELKKLKQQASNKKQRSF